VKVDHSENIDPATSAGRLSVLHVSQPVVGGVARGVIDLLRDQVERGWAVTAACPHDSELAAAAVETGATHVGWEATREPGLRSFAEARSLAAILRSCRPQIVHLHSSKAGLAGRLVLRGRVPTVFHPHGWSFDAVDGMVGRGAIAWERVASRWSDAVVCVSETERRRAEDRGVRARWQVVPNGVDLSHFEFSSADDRRKARTELDLPDQPFAVCIGRLCDAKGQDALLAAWPAVLERVPGARVVLVGEGPDRPALEAMAVSGVELVGHAVDVRPWLAAADVVAVPSRREGMSFAMIEAMASGRSVVATDVPGAREALGDDAGAIVAVGDRMGLATTLAERLLDGSLASREGLAGRRRAERQHDLRQATEAIAKVYEGVLAGRYTP
jgi:glycosyltransferase involved in cell wall biosynthesis